MRAPAVSFANKFFAALMAALLTFTLMPASAFAEEEGDSPSTEETQDVNYNQADEATGANASESTEPDTAVSAPLASVLAGAPTAFVNVDVTLNGEPVVGSFTVDRLTFAVTEGSNVQLVGVSSDWQQATGLQAGEGSPQPSMPASEAEGSDADSSALLLPGTVACNGVEYSVSSIGAYAFYLSGVTSVELPASVIDVDKRTFRSSDVASVEVADGNLTYSSFDGVLYDTEQLSLLLIPEGKQGTVLLPKEAESASPSVFSHCPLVTQIAVEEGSAAFASENGLLYDASLETLLRVPAGATEITIREGCATIAAGAMEACASLAAINAPASVTSISTDVFTNVPTVSLPAATVADDGVEGEAEASPRRVVASSQGLSAPLALPDLGSAPASPSTEASGSNSVQLTAMVALSLADDMLKIDPSSIVVMLDSEVSQSVWQSLGFSITINDAALADKEGYPLSGVEEQGSFYAVSGVDVYGNGGTLRRSGIDYPALTFTGDAYVTFSGGSITYPVVTTAQNPGCSFRFWGTQRNATSGFTSHTISSGRASYFAIWNVPITWESNGGYWDDALAGQIRNSTHSSNTAITGYGGTTLPKRNGHRFTGWKSSEDGDVFAAGTNVEVLRKVTYAAQWERVDYDLGFDVDSEPEDKDYPGIEKPDETITGDQIEADDKIGIEGPKRPGYVFQGWTIPNAEGTEAIDQDLVYEGEDGKWYVDASKLPDYADGSGRVELTARWTSVISVDVPSSVTFYADVVTQGNESREGAASSAFGQNKVASQSEVDLRIVGLESNAVETQGSTLGADSILKKATSAMPSSSTQKLFSLYPTSKALTPDDLQDPDAISAAKPADAVDFALDDILLEKSFAADKFTIPAGDTLNLGYRLNLSETGTELDYDKLSTLEEGQSTSIANISYCFAADYDSPADWGEPLWIENPDTSEGAPRFLVLDDIKAAAEDLSAHASNPAQSSCYPLYRSLLDQGASFHLNVGGTYHDVQVLGICQDAKTSGGKAGLTFGFKEVYGFRPMNAEADNTGGWASSAMRSYLNGEFFGALGAPLRDPATGIVPVDKAQQGGNEATTQVQVTRGDKVFIPSSYELYGLDWDTESSANSFQYQWFAKTETYMTGVGTICANDGTIKYKNGTTQFWWGRSGAIYDITRFCHIGRDGTRCFNKGSMALGVVPCFAL